MNNMRKKFFLLLAMLALVTNMKAQIRTLTLDSCRALAVNYNKELRMADKKVQAAYYERKAAFTKYLPRITATGAYLYTSKELSLLSDGQKEKLGNLGTTVSTLVPQLGSMSTMLTFHTPIISAPWNWKTSTCPICQSTSWARKRSSPGRSPPRASPTSWSPLSARRGFWETWRRGSNF